MRDWESHVSHMFAVLSWNSCLNYIVLPSWLEHFHGWVQVCRWMHLNHLICSFFGAPFPVECVFACCLRPFVVAFYWNSLLHLFWASPTLDFCSPCEHGQVWQGPCQKSLLQEVFHHLNVFDAFAYFPLGSNAIISQLFRPKARPQPRFQDPLQQFQLKGPWPTNGCAVGQHPVEDVFQESGLPNTFSRKAAFSVPEKRGEEALEPSKVVELWRHAFSEVGRRFHMLSIFP